MAEKPAESNGGSSDNEGGEGVFSALDETVDDLNESAS